MIENVSVNNDLIVNKGEGYTPSPPPSPSTTQKDSSSGPAVQLDLTEEVAAAIETDQSASTTSAASTAEAVKTRETVSNTKKDDKDLEKKLNETIDILNEKLNRMDREVQFKVDKKINRNYVSVIDKKSKEVIREFPPEEIRAFIAKFDEINAKLMNNSTDVKSLLVNLEV